MCDLIGERFSRSQLRCNTSRTGSFRMLQAHQGSKATQKAVMLKQCVLVSPDKIYRSPKSVEFAKGSHQESGQVCYHDGNSIPFATGLYFRLPAGSTRALRHKIAPRKKGKLPPASPSLHGSRATALHSGFSYGYFGGLGPGESTLQPAQRARDSRAPVIVERPASNI